MLLLSVMRQEISQFPRCRFQGTQIRKIHYTEMIRLLPVKTASMHQKYTLFPQKIIGKLLIVGNMELFRIQFRENVECCLRLYHRNARDILKCMIDKFPLFINSSARTNVFIDTLIPP